MRIAPLTLLVLLALRLGATEWVVDGANPAASDAAAGSASTPFRTIARGAQALRAGDTLSIRAGTYREAVDLHCDGTQASYATVRAWPGDEGKVVISGCDVMTGWAGAGGERWSIAWNRSLPAQYPTASWPTPTAMQLRTELVFVDGARLRQVLTPAELVRGTYCVDDANRRLLVQLADGGAPSAHRVEASTRQAGLSAGGNWLRVRGLTVVGVANTYQGAAFDFGGDDALIERCRAADNNLDGLHLAGNRLTARDNVAERNGECGISGNLWYCLIERNTTDWNSWRFGPGWADGGMKIVGGGPTGNVIRGHVSRHNDGPGIWFDWDCRDNRIEGCYVDDNLLCGIDIEASWPGNTIVDCVISRSRVPHGMAYDYTMGAGISLRESSGTRIWNNTIVDNELYGIILGGGVRGNGASTRDTDIRGNIFAFNRSAAIYYWLWDASADPAAVASNRTDGNLWWSPGAAYSTGHGREASTLAGLRALGLEANGVEGDPLLLDRAAGDLHLRPGSPAIDRAPVLAGVTSDFAGTARPQGAAPDIGAFEYVAGVVAPTRGPYGGTARALPGTLQAEDFDNGGEGVAYHDADAANDGGGYRATAVDIRACVDREASPTGDAGGGWQVGWFGPGEWLEYTVSVAAGGSFDLGLRVSSGYPSATVHVAIDGVDRTGAVTFATTGGWDTFTTVRRASIAIAAGHHVVRLACDAGALDCNWLAFTAPVSSGPVSGQWYKLVAKHSGKCLDVSGGSTAAAANVQQWSDNGTAAQQWRIDAVGDGSWTLTAKCSGQALDVRGGSVLDGGDVIQYPPHGGANQRWRLDDTGQGWYRVTSVNSGKVLDVAGASAADGADAIQWSDNGGANQRWALVPVPPSGNG